MVKASHIAPTKVLIVTIRKLTDQMSDVSVDDSPFGQQIIDCD